MFLIAFAALVGFRQAPYGGWEAALGIDADADLGDGGGDGGVGPFAGAIASAGDVTPVEAERDPPAPKPSAPERVPTADLPVGAEAAASAIGSDTGDPMVVASTGDAAASRNGDPSGSGDASAAAGLDDPPLPPVRSLRARPRPPSPVVRRTAQPGLTLPVPLSLLLRDVGRTLRGVGRAMNKAGASASAHGPISKFGSLFSTPTTDQDRARAAVTSGEIVPLDSVLKTVHKSVPGNVLKVSLDREFLGAWRYSITVLTPDGYYRVVQIDAAENKITQIREQ